MLPSTTFLVILIVSLILGNALLFMFHPKKIVKTPAQAAVPIQNSPVEMNDPMQNSSKLFAVERKLELAHLRIQDLERGIRVSGRSQGLINDDALKRRFEKLENFKSTAEAELIAMKEILAELQNNYITVKSRSFKNANKEKNISKEDLHKLIFHSST